MELKMIGRSVLDLVFPRACRSCGIGLWGAENPCFCDGCWKTVSLLERPCCPVCGKPFRSDVALLYSPSHRCGDCRAKSPRFNRAAAAGFYDGVLAEAIRLLKYGGQTRLAGALADLMVPAALRLGEADAILPVPLHPWRLKERDYNQALLLCDAIAKRLRMRVVADGLDRDRETPPQTGLPPEARRRNVRGAFSVRRPSGISGRRLILVDDVLTTGATVNECARTLKRAGAVSVGVLTLARVPLS
jgi:ComF family protein